MFCLVCIPICSRAPSTVTKRMLLATNQHHGNDRHMFYVINAADKNPTLFSSIMLFLFLGICIYLVKMKFHFSLSDDFFIRFQVNDSINQHCDFADDSSHIFTTHFCSHMTCWGSLEESRRQGTLAHRWCSRRRWAAGACGRAPPCRWSGSARWATRSGSPAVHPAEPDNGSPTVSRAV